MPKGKQGKAALASLGLVLIKRLSEPEVQDAIAKQAVTLADMAKKWNEERKDRPSPAATDNHPADEGGQSGSGGIGARFGQGKLERRVDHLESSIIAVTEGNSDAAEALAGASANLAAIRVSLEVAEGLPLFKRKQAHFRLDDELDKLERLVFDAAMPSTD